MGNKPYKIKRYKNIYGGGIGTGKSLKVVSIIAAVIVFCALGWMLYEPVFNLFTRDEEEISESVPTEESEESSHEVIAPPAEESSESEVSEEVSESEESSVSESEEASESEASKEESLEASSKEESSEAPAVSDVSSGTKGGVFAPHAILNDPVQLSSFLKELKEKGCTSIAVEAKNSMGEVLYLSENETAINSHAVVGNAFDAKKVAKAIKDAGLTPVAKIHGYRDGIAAAGSEMAVKYYDTTYNWLDNSPDLGGRGWLNPYNSDASEYIGSLAAELAEAGFKDIIVDSVHYPLGVGREKMGFGNTTTDKLTALTASMKKIERMAVAKGGRVSFVLNPFDYENDADMVYGGDILKNKDLSFSVTASVEAVETMDPVLEKINAIGKEPDVILLSFNYDGSQATGDKLKNMLSDFKDSRVGSIYLYNPQGIY